MPAIPGSEAAIAGWLTGASNTAIAGLGTAGAISAAVEKYGVAGTGAKITDLAGAAKEKAAAAYRGGGPIKNGGGGYVVLPYWNGPDDGWTYVTRSMHIDLP